MNEDHDAEQDHHRGAGAVPASDPGMDDLVGDEEEGHGEHRHARGACPNAGQQQAALRIELTRPFVLGEGREEQGLRGDPDAEGNREQGRRHGVERGLCEPSTIPTTTTSVVKTIFCAIAIRKLLKLNWSSDRVRLRER